MMFLSILNCITFSYDPMWNNKEKRGKIDWGKYDTALKLHNFIRGCDRVPGAWCMVGDEQVSLYVVCCLCSWGFTSV